MSRLATAPKKKISSSNCTIANELKDQGLLPNRAESA